MGNGGSLSESNETPSHISATLAMWHHNWAGFNVPPNTLQVILGTCFYKCCLTYHTELLTKGWSLRHDFLSSERRPTAIPDMIFYQALVSKLCQTHMTPQKHCNYMELTWQSDTILKKGKEEYLYSAILVRTHSLKVLRHGSHSFTCKQHHTCLPAFPS